MRNNGRTENFTLPVYSIFPSAEEGRLSLISDHETARNGVYIFLDNAWRFVVTEFSPNAATISKFCGRRSADMIVDTLNWTDIPIAVSNVKDEAFTHTVGRSEVTIAKTGRYKATCETSAVINSGNSVAFALRILTRPSNGNACTGIPVWTSSAVFLQDQYCQLDGILYKANWYTQGQDPRTNSGQYQSWTSQGSCTSGAANYVPVDGSYGYGSCAIKNVPSGQCSADADGLTLVAGSGVKVQVALLTSGSIALLSNSFRFNIEEC